MAGPHVALDVVLRLYDTATREVRELAMREPGKVTIYLCGPTVYGPPHLGHGRATLEYDVLVRYLRWSGSRCGWSRTSPTSTTRSSTGPNASSARGRRSPTKCERVWFEAMDGINVARPDDIPHATEYVDEMVAMIGQLVEIGRAYTTDDGVYLSVETVEDYGLLAHQSLDDMLAGGGEREVFGAEQKRHPADFVLWKLAKPGEPSWPSPWGEGRPGWHSECVVMSLDLLGEGFDLHCGGQDLRFPHHENERAQAVALGKRFANHWMHHGFVVDAEGEKMSKSLGNVDNLLDLLDALRRADVPDAAAAEPLPQPGHGRRRQPARRPTNALAGLDAFAARSASVGRRPAPTPTPTCSTAFVRAMDDDLDTPGAMALRVRHGAAGQRGARRRRRDGAGRSSPRCARWPAAVGLELGGGGRRAGRRRRAGGRPRRGAGRQGLRHGRRHPRRAAGRRVDRRDHGRRHHRPALSQAAIRPMPTTFADAPDDATGPVARASPGVRARPRTVRPRTRRRCAGSSSST